MSKAMITKSEPVNWGTSREFRRNDSDGHIFRKWHYHLISKIKEFGKSKRKLNGHGKDWILSVGDWTFTLDDYNSSIHINTNHIGGDFGGFHTEVNLRTYKYFVGLLFQSGLRLK